MEEIDLALVRIYISGEEVEATVDNRWHVQYAFGEQ